MEKIKNEILKSKIRLAISIIIFILLLGISIFSYAGKEMNASQLVICIALSLLIALVNIIPIKLNKVCSILLLLILPIGSYWILEGFSHNPLEIAYGISILNILFFCLLFLVLVFLSGSVKIGGIIGLVIPFLVGAANYFVVSFRSSPIVPWDFFSIKTAISVTDNYNFIISYRFAMCCLGFALLVVLAAKTNFTFKKLVLRIPAAIVCVLLIVGYTNIVQAERTKEVFNLNDTLFTPNHLYKTNGFAVSFLVNMQYLNIETPENYSLDYARELIREANLKSQGAQTKEDTDNQPNIIVIMNEAFSDLSVLGEFETNMDYMPFINSLSENTVSGDMYVSVKGGNTANTEFEFLTGNTLAFLPAGSVAYQQYIHSQTPNLAWQLGSLGYSTSAIHPYYSTGWNRDVVYQYFGFEHSYFKNDFINPELLRSYISDRETYNKIIDIYEDKEEDEKIFVFNVTMQNHGSYTKEYANFEPDITLEDTTSGIYTERYLSLIKQSDEAFEELVAYFENQDEETIILMFGDHQPADYVVTPIYALNGGSDDLTFEEEQNRYIVPFVMWANYDIEEQTVDKISPNYLGTLLLETAELPLTGYQQFLSNLRSDIPAITGNMYIDSEGNFYANGDNTYSEILDKYAVLQYNGLIDYENRFDSFFYLDDIIGSVEEISTDEDKINETVK